uniref:Uncharacterized protein n=1 Tax=Papio anubis TaxID=9555 RepID=A0A8I5MX08_PAPAN
MGKEMLLGSSILFTCQERVGGTTQSILYLAHTYWYWIWLTFPCATHRSCTVLSSQLTSAKMSGSSSELLWKATRMEVISASVLFLEAEKWLESSVVKWRCIKVGDIQNQGEIGLSAGPGGGEAILTASWRRRWSWSLGFCGEQQRHLLTTAFPQRGCPAPDAKVSPLSLPFPSLAIPCISFPGFSSWRMAADRLYQT